VISPETMPHDRAAELLPWLVNDSLDAGEREAVREHATSCVICRRELAQLETLRTAIVSADASGTVAAPNMRRINARIDALVDSETAGGILLAKLREWFKNPWQVAFVVQTALLVALVALWQLPQRPEPEFTTLTEPQTLPDGHYVRIVFDPTFGAARISTLLEGTGLSVATGPSVRGVYTLRFDEGTSDADRAAIVAALHGASGVLFVQPVAGEEDK
jgi:anti-sigma factor RsiW